MRLLLHSGSCCVCEHPGWFQQKAQMQLQMTSWIYFLKITSDFYAEELQIKMLSQSKGIQYRHFLWLGEIRVITDNVRVLVLMPLIQKCLTYLVLQYLAQNLLKHRERGSIQLSLHKLCRILCSKCIFSVIHSSFSRWMTTMMKMLYWDDRAGLEALLYWNQICAVLGIISHSHETWSK